MIRIMLVDDHPIVREALHKALSSEADFDVIAEAEDGESAVALARLFEPDVIIMDIGIPKMTGIEATRQILKENPTINIIGLSLYDDSETINYMKNAGVVAYFVKGRAFEPIFEVIRAYAK
jgi:DNA-binding NarL/FixJ family response regulator